MGNSNSHLVHRVQHHKAPKALQDHVLRNAKEDLSQENDIETKNADRLRMMPNIQAVKSAPFILDNHIQDAATDHDSGGQTHQLTTLDDQTRNIPCLDDIPAHPHSIQILLREASIKMESLAASYDSTSPVNITEGVPVVDVPVVDVPVVDVPVVDVPVVDVPVTPRAITSKSGLFGTPITKRQVIPLMPITPLIEASLETSQISNITSSISVEPHRFENLVDSNNVSYGSFDISFNGSGSLISDSLYIEKSEDFNYVDLRKETFHQRSTSDMLRLISSDNLDRKNKLLAKRRDLHKSLVKYNSCSTIFADRLFAFPGMKDILQSVSYFLEHQIHKSMSSRALVKTEDIFSEKLNPVSKHFQYHKTIPDFEVIFRYLECIFQSAELNAEVAIISLIYVERLLLNTEITLHSSNWARILLGGVMLASKVWDDHAIWNVDYCQIFPEMRSTDLNKLERRFLLGLDFNIGVRLSTYTKYYFALKEFAENFKPLNREAKALTAYDFKKLTQTEILEQVTSSHSICPDDSHIDGMVVKLSEKLLEDLENRSSKLDRSASDNFYEHRFVPAQIL